MEEKKGLKEFEIKNLNPGDVKIFRGAFNLIHLITSDGVLYKGVYALCAFPIRCPDKFIFLFYHDEKD
ncbi:MAG: hypothetical protein NC824_00220, partial [Candidatus Omnitrophica bacterium]|nr:hypothetical protein [Candidatus Omnitrophota bacterium]